MAAKSGSADGGKMPGWAHGLVLAALLLALGFLRLYNLGCAPYFFLDEGYNMETALGIMRTGHMVHYWFNWPWLELGKPITGFLLTTASFRLLGVGIWQGRLVSALFGIATGVLVYLLARRFLGRRAGYIALALYSCSQLCLYCDRSMKVDAEVAFFSVAACYAAMLAGGRSGRTAYAWLAGLLSGLAVATKFTAFYLVPALLLFLLLCFRGSGLRLRTRVLACCAFALMSSVPLAGWMAYYLSEKHDSFYAEGAPPGFNDFASPYDPNRGSTQLGFFAPPASARHAAIRAATFLGKVTLRQEMHLVGFIALAWGLYRRQRLYYLGAVLLGTGFLLLAVTGQAMPRYLHPAHILLLVMGAGLLSRAWTAGDGMLLRPALVVLVAAMCARNLLFVPQADGLVMHSLLRRDTAEIEAAQWLRTNVPAGETMYVRTNIGVLTGRRYYPLDYFADQALVYRRFRPRYLAVDRYLAGAILRGDVDNPFEHFRLRLASTVGGVGTPERVDIYEILGGRASPLSSPSDTGCDCLIGRSPSYNMY